MLTQMEVYKNIYINKMFEMKLTQSKERASRLANMYAIKHTWELFNDQKRIKNHI